MNPLRLQLLDFGSYERLDHTFVVGCCAIVGANGAGKSTLIEAIDVALFGARSLAAYVRDGCDRMDVELTFEHAGEVYRVRRGYSTKGRGKPTLDLESHDAEDGAWQPLTRGSLAETQQTVEDLLGLTRETLCASALLRQGDGAAFTEAQPRDRKRILAETLGLGVWDRLLELSRRDLRHAEQQVAQLDGKLAAAEERLAGRVHIITELDVLVGMEQEARKALAGAEAQLAHAQARLRELETAEAAHAARVAMARGARDRLAVQERILAEAAEAATAIGEIDDKLAILPTAVKVAEAEERGLDLAHQVAALDAERQANEAAVAAHIAATRERNALIRVAEAKVEEAEAKRDLAVRTASAESPVCDRCHRPVDGEARETIIVSLHVEADALFSEARALEAQAAEAIRRVPLLPPPRNDDDGAALRTQLAEARDVYVKARAGVEQRARLEERRHTLQAKVDETGRPEFVETLTRLQAELAEAEQAVGMYDPAALAEALADARATAANVTKVVGMERERLAYAREEQAGKRARLAELDELAAAVERDSGVRDGWRDLIDELAVLEKAYGRNGVPALIVSQSAIPSIETEANRILADLGTSYRVELRTEKQLKTGGVGDALDVVVVTETGERPYETFSGGEQTRLNLALRIALAELLASRRRAESRLLAIDEVEYLDAAGHAALVDVLRGLEDRFSRILLVSHIPELRDAFDNAVLVEKDDAGVSRLVAA